MLDFKRVRPLDAAIVALVVVVAILGGYLGYTVWQNSRQVVGSSPVSRGIEDLVASVRQNPDNLPMRMRLAQAYMLAGRRNEAVDQYETILKASKDYAPALAGLGTLALREGDFATAEGYFRRASELFAKQPGAAGSQALEQSYFYLGTALLEQKEYEEASSYFKAALRIKRDSSTTHYLLAVSLREMGLGSAYREALGNTLLFDPKHPEANYDYGRLLLADGDEASAAEHFRTSADSAPGVDFPMDALNDMGTVEERVAAARKLAASDPGQALIEARVAVAMDPKSVPAFLVLGDLYAEAGNENRARDAYRKVLTLDAANDAAKAGLERVGDGS
ncbi:MAG: tetratricopeptide repeat protein [Coriobacteriia bacterium]|nr:tetratricopeptide repeat protein [Coriobacteriia bacterium]